MEISAAIFAKGFSVSASPSVDFLSLVFVSVELTMEEAKQEITKEEVVDSAPNADMDERAQSATDRVTETLAILNDLAAADKDN